MSNRNNKRTIRHFPSQNQSLNSINNNINTYMRYSKNNNNTSNNNNQTQTLSQYNTNDKSSNRPYPTYHKRTTTSNYQFKYNKNSDSINNDFQNNNYINQRNNSSLTNTIKRYNQNKNNNITTNRFDNDNNNALFKSNDNYTINRRTNHRVFERGSINTNKNTNANTNINTNNNKLNPKTVINTNTIKINANTIRNKSREQNINEDKNRRYNDFPNYGNRISYKTAKVPDYKQKTTIISRIQPSNNIEQNDISKYRSFNSPINNRTNNNVVTSQLMDKNETINKEKNVKSIRAYYKTRYGSKITPGNINVNANDDNVVKNSINDNEFVNKSINFDSKLKSSINNEIVNKSINNNDNIQYKKSFRKSEIVNDSNNNEIITLKTPNIKEIDNELTKEQMLLNVTKKEIGIMNLGNSCFINACLQILIHCPLFIYNLIKKLNLINENTPITSNFLSICDIMANTKQRRIDISDFKNILGIKHVIYDSYMQNDSQEFCRILLEDISRELNEIKEITIYRMLSNSDRKSKKERDIDFHENFIQREKSIITDLFYAQVLNIFTCECRAEIYSFQKILDFPLLFPDNKNNDILSINDLLQLYFKTEYIDFESACQRCQKKAKHKKELRISRAPEILILSLQRIDVINRKKLDYLVNFPQMLDIYEFMDHDCGYDRDCKYELFGIINHMGGINSGHYYSYIKLENRDWFEFNDSKVSKIDNLSDTSESAYALFYIKEKYIGSTTFII